MRNIYKRLKEFVFGKHQESNLNPRTDPKPVSSTPDPPAIAFKRARERVPATDLPVIVPVVPQGKARVPERNPYLIQVGFDFGTAFSKCVCRDLMLDRVWVHTEDTESKADLPFLIPSTVTFDGRFFARGGNKPASDSSNVLPHVKMALERVALEQWEDPVLIPYRDAAQSHSQAIVTSFVELTAIYFLATAFQGVKAAISKRFPGNVYGDYVAVNMAVPVADADHPRIVQIFARILRSGWILADSLLNSQAIALDELSRMRDEQAGIIESKETQNACYLYPEVSANVQGFIRSRTSNPGIYLFSDTGAGTVDQSLFVFYKLDGEDILSYLYAQVLPLGSSQIERIVATDEGDISWTNLERWRLKKEAGESTPRLNGARADIRKQLGPGTARAIASARKKLMVQQQMNDLRIIFGGGGHCTNPYGLGVLGEFDGPLFPSKAIRLRRDSNEPFDLGMPPPTDLLLPNDRRHWLSRLTVAYGLSFEKADLAKFWLPNQIDEPSEQRIWRPRRRIIAAPSKDEV